MPFRTWTPSTGSFAKTCHWKKYSAKSHSSDASITWATIATVRPTRTDISHWPMPNANVSPAASPWASPNRSFRTSVSIMRNISRTCVPPPRFPSRTNSSSSSWLVFSCLSTPYKVQIVWRRMKNHSAPNDLSISGDWFSVLSQSFFRVPYLLKRTS